MIDFFGDLQDLYESTAIFESLSKLILGMEISSSYQIDIPNNLGVPIQVKLNLLPTLVFCT